MASASATTSALVEMNAARKKKLSVERIYQKKTPIEHILLRPDTYIGSVEEVTQSMWVFEEDRGFVQRQITFVPGLYKIFDEILVNAADNKQRDRSMNKIEIDIDSENDLIRIWNNGRGIPIETHKVEGKLVPTMIFGELLTSSNYDDTQKKVTGGRNGYGAKLCNIFSTKFTVETACAESGKKFKQSWKNNMSSCSEADVKPFSGRDYTCVTFKPDLTKFGMEQLDRDIVALMTRRAYDVAGATNGVKVYLNGKLLPVRSFRDYVDLYLKSVNADSPLGERSADQVVHEKVNDRWEVCVTPSFSGFQQVSFVNSIATTKGGSHIDHVTKQLVEKLSAAAKRRNKGGADMKPHMVKSHLWVFVNCLIENPAFDSQTKENMTLKVKSFGSECIFSDKFLKKVIQCGVVDLMVTSAQAKLQAQLSRKAGSTGRQTKLKGIPKLDDANSAGGKKSRDCTLILTEGDSAKTLAVSGLSVVGRDLYGVFPLRGKVLNVREASAKQMTENAEITNIVKIMGLKYGKKYTESDLSSLRYGHLMVMTDQDQDGSHIKGLLINFIHYNWPSLLRVPFMEQFITPIVKVSKGKEEIPFYSIPEFEEWKQANPTQRSWKVKYYKGLGTSTPKEAKEYFQDMERHRISFSYSGPQDDESIKLAFSKSEVDARKRWLDCWLQERKDKRAQGLNESYLYGSETDVVTYSDFVNKELVQFSNADNERSIPSIVDGLKPGQRKVLFTCFKRNDKREIKVAQLAGSVAELSAYHHGETSLMTTIINLAQNFVGSNNLNLLQPIGQFGTRLHGGKDAASPRYIFTMLSPLARVLFPAVDDNCLHFLTEDNLRIEPEWYCPIIPLVLVNGSEGIGTGYSSMVPNYDVREIVENLKRLLRGEEAVEMVPSYKGFTGTISQIEPSKYAVYGTISRLDDHQVEITELPVRSWTQTYKEKVVEVMLHGTDKVQPGIIDCMEYHTDTTVRFVLNLTKETAAECEKVGYHKKFKLEGSVTTSNLVLFDHNGCLRKYSHVHEILHEFFSVRLEMYGKRKSWLEGQLAAESKKLNNQARYIDEVLERKINISGKLKDVVSLLKERKYDSDPVKSWKEKVGAKVDSDKDEDSDEEADKLLKAHWPDYDYLLGTTTRQFTEEKRDELLRKKKAKSEELRILQGNTPSDLWSEDLDHFMIELEKLEQKEKEALEMNVSPTLSQGKKGSKGKRPGKARQRPKLTSLGVVAESLPQATPEDVIPPIIPKFSDKKEKTSKRGKKESPGENEKANEDKGQRSLKDFFALDVEQDDKDDTEKKQTEKSSKQGSLPCQETDALKLACPAKRGKSKLKPKPTDSIDDVMDVKESESDTCEPKPPRAAPPRRAAAAGTKRYTYETSDEDSEDDKDDTEKKQTEKSSKQASLPSQETDPPMLACPIKRGRSKLKPKIIDSIEDVVDSASDKSGSDIGEPKPKRIAPSRRVAAAGTKRYTCEISDEASEQSEDDTTGDSDNDFAYVKPLKKRLSPMEAVKEKPAEGKGSKKRLVSVKATGKQPPKEKETSKQVKLRKQPTVTEVLSNAQNRKRKAKEPVFVIESDEDEEASFDRIIDSQSKRNQNTKARKGGSTKIETDEDDDHGDEDFAADDDDDDEDDEDFTL